MGYRQIAQACQLCCREPGPDQQLKPMGELSACEACRQGVPRDAARAWRLQLRGEDEQHEKHGRYGSAHSHSVVQVVLPTEIPMWHVVRQGSRAGQDWGRLDSERGGDSMDPELTRELVSDVAVRGALFDAAAAIENGKVELNRHGVTLEATDRTLSVEQREELDRRAIVLAVSIERWVRGQPHSAPTRPGCVDRPQQAQVDPRVPREPPIPWVSPSAARRDNVPPGPPCPGCGEPTVNAVTEYICKRCGHVEDRPEVRQRLRKRALKARLIVVAVVVALAALAVVAAMLNQ